MPPSDPNFAMNRTRARRTLAAGLLFTALLALSGCGTSRAISKDSTPEESPFLKHFSVDAGDACAAANRALLGDGYLTESLDGAKIKGRKAYRDKDERSMVVEMTVVCLQDEGGGSTLYANGLRSTYELKKSATPASIGVSVLGSVSLPIGQSADSMVKTADETITERHFYSAFFAAVEAILRAGKRGGDAEEMQAEPAPATSSP